MRSRFIPGQLALSLLLALGLMTSNVSRGAEQTPLTDICDLPLLVRIQPVYPARAQSRGIEGFVLLEFHVQPNGDVSDVTVVESEPDAIFDREAARAVQRWVFAPDVDRAVARTRVRLVFQLEGDDTPLGPCDPDQLFKDDFEG